MGVGSSEEPRTRSTREKRRTIVYLRGLLLVAMGGLLLGAGAVHAGTNGIALLAVYTLSNVALLFNVPSRIVRSLRFELVVGAIDVAVVGLTIALAGAHGGVLPVSCLLLALVLALAHCRTHAIAGTVVVTSLHAWSQVAITHGDTRQLATQTLFLGSLALYYGYLAEAIHSYRSHEDAEKFSLKELKTLFEILDAISSTPDLEQVTRFVVRKIAEIVPAVRCSMLFVDKTRTRCFVIASHDDPELSMLELSLEKYPEVRRAIETKGPVLIDDIGRDPLMADVREVLEKLDLHSIMVVPIVFGDDLLGTLCMKTARASRPFSERELNFCNAVARAAGGALKSAALHREINEASCRQRVVAEKLTQIFDHSPDLIVTTDVEGRITEFNRAAERLLGCDRKRVLDRACEEVLGSEVEGLVSETLGGGLGATRSCRLRKENGDLLEAELSTAVLRNPAGEPTGTVWLGRDVSELKATHRRLLLAEKLSTVGEVIAGVAHELNNPLSGVLGYSQLLLARHGESAMRRELERIHDSALRCQKIVGNLLSFARGDKPERRLLGINGIIEKTLDIKKYQLRVHNIEVIKELDAALPRTLIDFHQIQQVLLNLLNNAQHAITTAAERRGRVHIRTSHRGGWIRIEVADTGVGMGTETLERIFDPFFTTKESGQGTGLGLSVSYGIVKEHGGRIQARSEQGKGSTFVIELPVHEGEVAEAVETDRPVRAEGDVAGERILVVDDEPLILDLMVDVLCERGYRVDTAGGGEEACRKVDAQSYDLVISDVRMPRMSGLELYRRIIAAQPALEGRVIFITGDLLERETIDFLAEIQVRTLAKPLDIDVVLGAVAGTLLPGAAGVTR